MSPPYELLRLNDDGSVAAAGLDPGPPQHPGLAFDAGGQLWADEMGPMGGDELNRIEKRA